MLLLFISKQFHTFSARQRALTQAEIARINTYQELLDEADSRPSSLWTISHWRVKIDRERSRGMFVILDPMDPAHELYLTEAEYKALVTTSLRASTTIKVISRPDSAFSWEPLPTSVAIAEHNAALRLSGDKAIPNPTTNTSERKGFLNQILTGSETPDPNKDTKGSPPVAFGGPESAWEFASWRDALPLLVESLKKGAESGWQKQDLSLEDSIKLYKAWQNLLSRGPALVTPKKGKPSQLVWGRSWSKHCQDSAIHWALGSVFRWTTNFGLTENQLPIYKDTFAPGKKLSGVTWESKKTAVAVLTGHKRNLVSALSLWGKLLSHWNSITPKNRENNRALAHFALTVGVLLSRAGPTFTIKYLKVSLFALNSFLAGRRLEDTRAHGLSVGLRNGLPTIIPRYWRGVIRAEAHSNSEPRVIRLVASLLNSYKALQGPYPEPPFKTIMADPLPPDVLLPTSEAIAFWRNLKRLGHVPAFDPAHYTPQFRTSGKAGPNGPALHAAGVDALVWAALYRDRENTPICQFLSSHEEWTRWMKVWTEVLTAAREELDRHPERYRFWTPQLRESRGQNEVHKGLRPPTTLETTPLGVFRPEIPDPDHYDQEDRHGGNPDVDHSNDPHILKPIILPFLGKLAVKREPAGKVRVFALVDYWTQAVMSAFHSYFFDLLKVFPSDATFDQTGTLQKFVEKGYREFYCYDLTSATDMIPVGIYTSLLTPILGAETTASWLELLTDRAFLWKGGYPLTHQETLSLSLTNSYRYTRGQPMGALSSWASLALGHHFLLWLSYCKVREELPITFNYLDHYLVLGDDLVISNEKLAKSYLCVCEEFGIPIGLAKSYTSASAFLNFANQSWLGTRNLSPLSLREEIGAVSSSGRREMVGRLVSRGWVGLGSLVSYKPGEALESLNRAKRVLTLLRAALNPFQWNSETAYFSNGRISLPGLAALRCILAPTASRKTPWGSDYRLLDFELWIFSTLASYGHLEMKSGFLSYLGQEKEIGTLVPISTLQEIAERVCKLPNSPERVLDYVADFDFDKSRRSHTDPVFTQAMVPLYEAALSSLEHCPRPTDVDPSDEHDWFVFDDEAWSTYEMKRFMSLKSELGMTSPPSEEGESLMLLPEFGRQLLQKIYNWIQIHLNLVAPHNADLIMFPKRERVDTVNLRERNLLMELLSVNPPPTPAVQTGETPWGVVESFKLRHSPDLVANELAEAIGDEPFAVPVLLEPRSPEPEGLPSRTGLERENLQEEETPLVASVTSVTPSRVSGQLSESLTHGRARKGSRSSGLRKTLRPEDDPEFLRNLERAFERLDSGEDPQWAIDEIEGTTRRPWGKPRDRFKPSSSESPISSIVTDQELLDGIKELKKRENERAEDDPDWMSEPHFPWDWDPKTGTRKWSKYKLDDDE